LWRLVSRGRATPSPLRPFCKGHLKKTPPSRKRNRASSRRLGNALFFVPLSCPAPTGGSRPAFKGGTRAGEGAIKGFAVGRGVLTQPLFNAGLPASLRRGDIEVLI